MKQRYKLIAPYPNHQIGDIAEFIQNPGPVKNEFYWIKCSGDPDIPMNFWPIIAVDWFEKVEDEKTLEDYETILMTTFRLNKHWLQSNYPQIYWTEVLRVIAQDLNSKSNIEREYKYYIIKGIDHGISANRCWLKTYLQGSICFNNQQDCQKAIDLLNNNLKYLFNEE